ncbi:MAG TPA: PIN domain-containing protein [Kofleriaceae bacterium]|nr:PIN domain-containing protein [Kofleriaceae bacterium]
MLAAPFRVVLDACVLYPMHLRDVLLQAAAEGLYQVYWSREILDEATRNLVANLQVEESKATRLVKVMSDAFPEAAVTDYEHLIGAMRNDPDDRHVVAAALKAGAQVVVTENLRDFSPMPEGVEAQTADEFLCNLFDLNPERMMVALEKICARRTRPPNEIVPLAEATRCADFAKLVAQFTAFNSNTYDVKAFRFWGEPTDEMTVLEFTYADDSHVRVCFPTSTLSQLGDELIASLERNAARRVAAGTESTRWQLEPIHRPRRAGPEQLITALRVSSVSFFEALSGDTIMIRFGHPDDDATLVHLTNDAARLLLQHMRNRLGFHA